MSYESSQLLAVAHWNVNVLENMLLAVGIIVAGFTICTNAVVVCNGATVVTCCLPLIAVHPGICPGIVHASGARTAAASYRKDSNNQQRPQPEQPEQ